DPAEVRQEAEGLREKGVYRGIGFSTYTEICGNAPSRAVGPSAFGLQGGGWESATVRVHASGSVTLYTGTSPHGQGHETGFAQIVADRLGVDPSQVEVIHGDTQTGPFGLDTYGSRSLAVGGEAAARAANKVAAKAKAIVAHQLEAAAEDIELHDGKVHGGIVHGIGQALYERIHYDEAGQLVTGTFVDYALATAAELPSFETDRTETRSPVNSLGVKGVGEAGTIAATPAITNAVIDALRPLGVNYIDMPLSPMRVWEAIQEAKGGVPA